MARITRFLFIGGINVVLTFGVFSLLFLYGFSYQLALTISAITGILFSSALNKSYTFTGEGYCYFFAFVAVYVLTVGLNIYLVGVLIEATGLAPITSQAILVAPIAGLTYVLLSLTDHQLKKS